MQYDIFSAYIVGYKNKIKNSKSQDYLMYKKLNDGVICSIADGHGIKRCKYSHIGSEFACKSCLEVLSDLYEDINKNIDIDIFIKGLIESNEIQMKVQSKWRKRVVKHFKDNIPNVYNIDYVLYGTTLLGVLVTDKIKLYLQIGDGNIVEYNNKFNLINYEKESKIKGIVNSMYLDDAYKYIDLKISKINNKEQLDSIILFSDGFTNSFKNYKELNKNLTYTIKQYRKNVFTKNNLKKTYKKYLDILSMNNSKDDISIIFIL